MCVIEGMRTNIDIDETLLKRAMKLSQSKTKKEAVDIALRWFVKMGRQKAIRKNRGNIAWEGDLHEMRNERPTGSQPTGE